MHRRCAVLNSQKSPGPDVSVVSVRVRRLNRKQSFTPFIGFVCTSTNTQPFPLSNGLLTSTLTRPNHQMSATMTLLATRRLHAIEFSPIHLIIHTISSLLVHCHHRCPLIHLSARRQKPTSACLYLRLRTTHSETPEGAGTNHDIRHVLLNRGIFYVTVFLNVRCGGSALLCFAESQHKDVSTTWSCTSLLMCQTN